MAGNGKLVGQPVKRREDPRLITGCGSYVDDVRIPGTLHAAFARSPYAHARVQSVSVDAARGAPGVVAVFTGADVKGKIGALPTAVPAEHIPSHSALAIDRVRYMGEPVAVVVAESPLAAEDAVDLIEIDYDPLPVVTDPEQALEAGAPVLHEEFGTNLANRITVDSDRIEQAMREADRVVKFRLVNQRLAPFPMEPRGLLANWNAGSGELTVWVSTQGPHLMRSLLAEVLALPEHKMRVIAIDVGGGFGCKFNVYGDEVMTAWLAMTLKRPVKWTERRRENFAATTHGRDLIVYVEAAVKNDGTILGLKARFICDMGAYFQLVSPRVPGYAGLGMTGCYRIPALAFEQVMVFTNKMATDAYRGAGRPEATYNAERMIEIVAAELGLDPLEVRRKNFIPPDAFPFQTAGGLLYDSGNYAQALDKALELLDYDRARAAQAEARAKGRYVGVGVASYVEISGVGPPGLLPPKLKGGWESATVRLEPDCKMTVLTGLSPHGQGQETTFAQLTADAFGLAIEDVNVIHGDTSAVQYGLGTFGSRGAAVGGTAVMAAVGKLQDKLKRIAATMIEAPPERLTFHQGAIALDNDPARSIPLQRVVDAAYQHNHGIPDIEPGLEASGFFSPSVCSFGFGTHAAMVEIDAETGRVAILRYVGIDDCGRIINPLLVEGQIHGGIAQGIGQALYEEVVYDEGGQLLSGTLMDYAVPKAEMLPDIKLGHTVTPSPANPLGVKGIGEAGAVVSPPCIVNAVIDALSPLGIRHLDMPLKPERLWNAIRKAAPR